MRKRLNPVRPPHYDYETRPPQRSLEEMDRKVKSLENTNRGLSQGYKNMFAQLEYEKKRWKWREKELLDRIREAEALVRKVEEMSEEKRKMEEQHRREKEQTEKERRARDRQNKTLVRSLEKQIEELERTKKDLESALDKSARTTAASQIRAETPAKTSSVETIVTPRKDASSPPGPSQPDAEEKGTGPHAAQIFLSIEDSLSIGEAVSMLHMVNSEISQVSALFADIMCEVDVVLRPAELRGESLERTQMQTKAVQVLGPFVAPKANRILLHMRPDGDPSLIQHALQVSLTNACWIILTSWFPGSTIDQKYISRLYACIRERESQAVAGRWRAIARSQYTRLGDHEPVLWKFLVNELVAILVFMGASEPRMRNKGFVETIMGRVKPIVQVVLRLHAALGEGITSADIQPTTVRQGRRFDPRTMDAGHRAESEKDSKRMRGQLVVSTIGLGLIKSGRVPAEDEVLHRPLVMLESEFNILAGRAP